MSEQFKAALARAFVGGVVSAGSVFFSIMSVMGAGVGKAGVAAGAAFFGVLAARGFGEGSYDTNREKRASTPGGGRDIPLPVFVTWQSETSKR